MFRTALTRSVSRACSGRCINSAHTGINDRPPAISGLDALLPARLAVSRRVHSMAGTVRPSRRSEGRHCCPDARTAGRLHDRVARPETYLRRLPASVRADTADLQRRRYGPFQAPQRGHCDGAAGSFLCGGVLIGTVGSAGQTSDPDPCVRRLALNDPAEAPSPTRSWATGRRRRAEATRGIARSR